MGADPAAFRQTLLNSITDDGLEELTLRLAKPDYQFAYRSGPGSDSGIDVLSDMELPPERGWQAKNHARIDWDDCCDSLAIAMMSDEHPPAHYTFVFPKPLTGRQRETWRKTFKPAQLAKYRALKKLDLWDNLAERLEDRPELVDSLVTARWRLTFDGSMPPLLAQASIHSLRRPTSWATPPFWRSVQSI